MKYTTLDMEVPSNDNIHTLFGRLYIPIGTPKATVQIIHGMSEHLELYDEFMSFLAENGYVVFMHDQLGHGRTAGSTDKLGFFAQSRGDELLVDDAHTFAQQLLEDYSGLKHVVFGHSMGSFVARICSVKYPDMCDMLIMAGTGGRQHGAALGLALTEAGGRVKGIEYRSDVSQRVFMDIYNTGFKNEKNDFSWITRDEDVIRQHHDDEYYNFTFSVKAMNDLVMLSTRCNSDEWFDNFRTDMPTLIISGEKDPVGENGRGVLEVFRRLREKNALDLSFKLYGECRHELLHELNRSEVMQDILVWLNNRV